MFATAQTTAPLYSPMSRSADSSLNFDHLLRMLDAAGPSLVEKSSFTLDGLIYDVRRVAYEEGQRFVITLNLGYLPFTVESPERRDAIRQIVAAAQSLKRVRFAIDSSSKISVGGVFEIRHPISPNFVFYPLTLFLQEARPFIQLIGQYLLAPKPVAEEETPPAQAVESVPAGA